MLVMTPFSRTDGGRRGEGVWLCVRGGVELRFGITQALFLLGRYEYLGFRKYRREAKYLLGCCDGMPGV